MYSPEELSPLEWNTLINTQTLEYFKHYFKTHPLTEDIAYHIALETLKSSFYVTNKKQTEFYKIYQWITLEKAFSSEFYYCLIKELQRAQEYFEEVFSDLKSDYFDEELERDTNLADDMIEVLLDNALTHDITQQNVKIIQSIAQLVAPNVSYCLLTNRNYNNLDYSEQFNVTELRFNSWYERNIEKITRFYLDNIFSKKQKK